VNLGSDDVFDPSKTPRDIKISFADCEADATESKIRDALPVKSGTATSDVPEDIDTDADSALSIYCVQFTVIPAVARRADLCFARCRPARGSYTSRQRASFCSIAAMRCAAFGLLSTQAGTPDFCAPVSASSFANRLFCGPVPIPAFTSSAEA